jgi:hypothetical protein
MVNKVKHSFIYDFKCEVHLIYVQKVFKDSYNFKQMCVLGFCGINIFHQLFPFPFQTTNPPLHSHFVPNVHFVVSLDSILIIMRSHLNIHHHAQKTNVSFEAIQINAR